MRGDRTIHKPADTVDYMLTVLFLFGIYVGVAARLPGNVPVPAVIAGAAGLAAVVKHANRMTARHVVAIVAVVTLYAVSVLVAPDYRYLGERFKGLIQIGYSLVIGYGFYLVAMGYDRAALARIFGTFCVLLLIGSALESYVPAVRGLSDAVRARIFEFGVYAADIRDQVFYGRIRPKLFTSEPSALAFVYTLFAFAWYALSRWRAKTVVYLMLLAGGYFLMRSPTLLLGAVLVPLYRALIAPQDGRGAAKGMTASRVLGGLAVGGAIVAVAALLGAEALEERIAAIVEGRDLSFFARVVAPILTAKAVLAMHPITGAGLTGWEYIEGLVQQIYANAPGLTSQFQFDSAAHALTNYFWLHWIFLGLFWGGVLLVALTCLLRALDTPSVLFCWGVWVVMGQASGGYVDPRTWTVLLLACAVSVLHARRPAARPVAMRPRRPIADAGLVAYGSH